MSPTMPHNAWLFFSIVLVSLVSAGAVHAATETVTLKNGKTYEVKTDKRGEPVWAKNRYVEITEFVITSRASPSSDTPVYVWKWNTRLKRRGPFKVTVTTPIDETVSASSVVMQGENRIRFFFDSEEYPTLWTWLDEPETSWIPFVFSFKDTQSDNTFELTQWRKFSVPEKQDFVVAAYIAAEEAAESDSGHPFTTNETIQPIFDDRVWELGYTTANGDQRFWEFVLSGETVENWSELITVVNFLGSQGSSAPADLMRRAIDGALHECPDTTWKLIRESKTEVLYEFRAEGCQGSWDDQYTIVRIIKGSSGLQSVEYANKQQLYLPEVERSAWIDRISRAKLVAQISVADNAKRSYRTTPARAIPIDGGSVAIRAGVRGDPTLPMLPFGKMKYPARYFVDSTNETDKAIWVQVHWYFPHKRKDKFKQKSGAVLKIEAGEEMLMWWPKYGIVADKEHPLRIIISTDEEQKNILHTEDTQMYFAKADIDAFQENFDDLVRRGVGRLPEISGWYEMNSPKRAIPGTATDTSLQADIQLSLWKEQSKKYRDCEHEILRAEYVDDEDSAEAVSEVGERDRPVSKSQHVLREFWWVRSCDVTSKYEVLLAESSDGAAEIIVKKIGETN